MTDKITQKVVKELNILEKNINELQKSLQNAYIRIGELNDELHQLRQEQTNDKFKRESKVFENKAIDVLGSVNWNKSIYADMKGSQTSIFDSTYEDWEHALISPPK